MSAEFIRETQDDGRIVVRHPAKKEWAIICDPDEVERAEGALDTRFRQMLFLISSGDEGG